MKVVISVILLIRNADMDVAFLASAALTITFIIGIKGSSIKGTWGGSDLLMNSIDSVGWCGDLQDGDHKYGKKLQVRIDLVPFQVAEV